jgi:predicted amino acid dehydrogenase
MTDKELLELAAKAAGIEIKWDTPYKAVWDFAQVPNWTPLTDDGDALRLAVILGMNIKIVTSGVFVSRFEDEPVIAEKTNDDVYAATRRAITRAAAAIGEAMKS